jgi:hypothetical protein
MANAFSNGLKIAATRMGSIAALKPQKPPLQGIYPVKPLPSTMNVPAQTVQQQVPAVTPQSVQPPGMQSSLIKDVLRRKRMLEI